MTRLRTRTAVSPLRRRFAPAPAVLPTVDELIARERPEEPMHCLRPCHRYRNGPRPRRSLPR